MCGEDVMLGLYNPNYHGMQPGTMVKTKDETVRNAPFLTGMPESFSSEDEWYAFDQGPNFDEAEVLYYIDENTLESHGHRRPGEIEAIMQGRASIVDKQVAEGYKLLERARSEALGGHKQGMEDSLTEFHAYRVSLEQQRQGKQGDKDGNWNLAERGMRQDPRLKNTLDTLGLDSADRRVLGAMVKHFDGGPVGLQTVAAVTAEEERTLEEVIEPFLLQCGLIERTPRGRQVTPAGFAHLDGADED